MGMEGNFDYMIDVIYSLSIMDKQNLEKHF